MDQEGERSQNESGLGVIDGEMVTAINVVSSFEEFDGKGK